MGLEIKINIKEARLENLGPTEVPEETDEGYDYVPATAYRLYVRADISVAKTGLFPLSSKGYLYVQLVNNMQKAMYDKGIYGLQHFRKYAQRFQIEVPCTFVYERDYVFALEEGTPMPKYYIGAYAEVGCASTKIVWAEVRP